MSDFYKRKLYALLRAEKFSAHCDSDRLSEWWSEWESASDSSRLHLSEAIASSSDRVNLEEIGHAAGQDNTIIKHPISGQSQEINPSSGLETAIQDILSEADPEKVFWWFWRFYPEIIAQNHPHALLKPAHQIIPDCPEYSYRATVSAITGALFPPEWRSGDDHKHPYLLLFTFSPVQEFIQASRKFLDFWAGSYMLHYLSAKVCWYIAEKYGPDAVITPSLWSQEIIDALILRKFPNHVAFQNVFSNYSNGKTPVYRFNSGTSTSLSTAGFPNVITALVPGQDAAKELGKDLGKRLREEWQSIAEKVREHVKFEVMEWAKNTDNFLNKWYADSSDEVREQIEFELKKLRQGGCWEWNKLWSAQIENTWQSYWTAVPLGNPEQALQIDFPFDPDWKENTEKIAPSRSGPTPTEAEEKAYKTLNVGTWWGNVQARTGQLIQSVKNTRSWQIAVAPGERSTLSGQFTALHPFLHYDKFREGAGMPARSMGIFWRVMADVYPGLFNGSEKLNALELTKRMAWQYGGVAASLGIEVKKEAASDALLDEEDRRAIGYDKFQITPDLYYERLIRFPNLSSIAAAKFAGDNPELVRKYWQNLAKLIKDQLPEYKNAFGSRTRGRPFQITKTDSIINPTGDNGKDYNGVMFSSKWLAEDMGLEGQEVNILRSLVEQAHQNSGFDDGSPADWWAIALADGDGMGKYVSGNKLKEYEQYIVKEQVSEESQNAEKWDELLATRKRMGPATHVGLNRALLDFSNRLVPYLTEKRFCGKVVYSGGDDVMALLPLEDLPEYLLSLRAAWCGSQDPAKEFDNKGGYWQAKNIAGKGLPDRPLFTMGKDATMSVGIVIAYKSIPLPTVLETLWTAEKDRAKKLPGKDGLCFRVIYGGGNVLEALMKGHLLESWWHFIDHATPERDISPMLYRLVEELPRRGMVTECDLLFCKAAEVIWDKSELGQNTDSSQVKDALLNWLEAWEKWAWEKRQDPEEKPPLDINADDLGKLLRFSAFWVAKKLQRENWVHPVVTYR
ncbi:MAG: type III-B CRISPR-associated protein Cas10/Cmr2 [Hormoscilla sp. SP5CHS1]|nr:type III-B CRISPR-associated protein Cas10/Cmr2 [Hormoscilla sp. SP12CHS1]MBC6452040.1 type III-B CRISPR-associated protein Cas10/Cmr2 [Hormoscilla sp. SP5CHS1]